MIFSNEAHVRALCRAIFSEARGYLLRWTEPNFGSSVGLPDVEIAEAGGGDKLPCELKYWHHNSSGLVCKMRPMQRQYHFLEAKAGRRTAIIYGVAEGGGSAAYILPGKYRPDTDTDTGDRKKVETHSIRFWHSTGNMHIGFDKANELFLDIIGSETFWI